MTFRPSDVPTFLNDFEKIKNKIRSQPGCLHLELLQDIHSPNIVFTYSFWENEDHLNDYRHTELFAQVWKRTKAKFGERAKAWSVKVASETYK